MKALSIKYSFLVVFFFLSCSLLGVSELQAKDKYSFEYVKQKVYDMNTDIWVFELFKNGEALRTMNVYVKSNFDGARILVDSDFNTSWNMYTFSKKRFNDNFYDSYRMQESSVNSLDEAVKLAVDHYIEDQVANK